MRNFGPVFLYTLIKLFKGIRIADLDPEFFQIADPDPVSSPGIWWPKIDKNVQL